MWSRHVSEVVFVVAFDSGSGCQLEEPEELAVVR